LNVTIKCTKPENIKRWGRGVTLELEEYLCGVVAAEIGEIAPFEAQKAQAVAARSYAVAAIHSGAKELPDNTGFQAFRYYDQQKIPTVTAAVKATSAQVLYYNGSVVKCWYAASNNGQCKSSAEVWGGKTAWTVTQPDPWDQAWHGQNPTKKKSGHQVGMSQVGAVYAAGTLNKTYKEILAFYYPNATLARLDGANASPASGKPSVQALIDYAVHAEAIGGGYVWGSSGEISSPQFRAQCLSYNKNAGQDNAIMVTSAKWDGKRVWDCSGLFRGAAREAGLNKSGGATSIWKKWCTGGKGAIVADAELVAGAALFRANKANPAVMEHIGLYIGNNQVIEAKGAAYGVIKTKLKAGEWTHWAYLDDWDYGFDTGARGRTDASVPQADMTALPVGAVWAGVVKTARDGEIGLWRDTQKTSSVRMIPDGHTVAVLDGASAGMVKAACMGDEGFVDSQYLVNRKRINAEPITPTRTNTTASAGVSMENYRAALQEIRAVLVKYGI
jgi:cell wall-associated NlpC family hydrolase